MSETINTGTYQNNPSGGGCGTAALWLLLIALILSCLCCGGFVGSAYYVGKAIQNGLEEDPVITQEKTVDAFGELNLPENVQPHAFFTLKLFGKELGFAGFYSWNVPGEAAPAVEIPAEEAAPVEEQSDDAADSFENKGAIVFYSLSSFLKGNEKEFAEGVSEGLTDNKNKDVTVKRSETVPVAINGKTSVFTFSWMEENRGINKRCYMMASGSFESKTGTNCNVVVYLPGEPSTETVTEVLENIQK